MSAPPVLAGEVARVSDGATVFALAPFTHASAGTAYNLWALWDGRGPGWILADRDEVGTAWRLYAEQQRERADEAEAAEVKACDELADTTDALHSAVAQRDEAEGREGELAMLVAAVIVQHDADTSGIANTLHEALAQRDAARKVRSIVSRAHHGALRERDKATACADRIAASAGRVVRRLRGELAAARVDVEEVRLVLTTQDAQLRAMAAERDAVIARATEAERLLGDRALAPAQNHVGEYEMGSAFWQAAKSMRANMDRASKAEQERDAARAEAARLRTQVAGLASEVTAALATSADLAHKLAVVETKNRTRWRSTSRHLATPPWRGSGAVSERRPVDRIRRARAPGRADVERGRSGSARGGRCRASHAEGHRAGIVGA